MRKKQLYPCVAESEAQRSKITTRDVNDEPDWLPCGKPNYEKFEKMGWDCEKTLVWLNID